MSISFGTPLRTVPAAGKKVCLYAYFNYDGGALIDANGYYG